MSKNNGGDNNKDEKNAVKVDASNIIDAVGFLLLREHNKVVFAYQGTKDIKLRVAMGHQMDHIKGLIKSLGIEPKEIEENKLKGGGQ